MPTVKLTIEIEVPEDCAYTSVDFDGIINGHTAKPRPVNRSKDGLLYNEWVYNGKGDRTIGEIYLYESPHIPILNWRETLTKVKQP
jgi:hypothetical protein